MMLLPCPLTLLLAAKVAGLKATVGLLLILLIKSQLLRVKMSFLGSVLGLVLTLSFLVTTGALVVISAGAVAWACSSAAAPPPNYGTTRTMSPSLTRSKREMAS